jgi:cytosine/uracil/thiamine/allantoin permease
MQIPISRNEGTMAGTAQQPAQHSDAVHPKNRRGKHVHHGRTLAAWVGSVIALVAFILGAIALVIPGRNWPLFWVAVGVAVVAIIVTVVLQRMGYGAH